jgi:hypothetical protein
MECALEKGWSFSFMRCAGSPMKDHFKLCMLSFKHGVLFLGVMTLVFCGCKKKEEVKKPDPVLPTVYADRANDKDYMASLKASREQQVKEARERVSLSLKMTQCVTRVRGSLPPEATAEAVQKALEADQGWKDLDSQIKKLEEASAETLKQARALIRKRMQDELRDNQAISKGEAKAIDNVLPTEK